MPVTSWCDFQYHVPLRWHDGCEYHKFTIHRPPSSPFGANLYSIGTLTKMTMVSVLRKACGAYVANVSLVSLLSLSSSLEEGVEESKSLERA